MKKFIKKHYKTLSISVLILLIFNFAYLIPLLMGSLSRVIGHNLTECYNFLPNSYSQYIISFNLERKLHNLKYFRLIEYYIESNVSEENKLKILKKLHTEFLKRKDPELLNTIIRLVVLKYYSIDQYKLLNKYFIEAAYELFKNPKIEWIFRDRLCYFLLTKYCDDYEKSKNIIDYYLKYVNVKLELLKEPYYYENGGKKFKTYVKMNDKYLFENGVKNQ